MLSVIIATLDSERLLVRTLAALVPGATAGLISQVLVADAGSGDDTAEVADIAGCTFLAGDKPLGPRLKIAAAKARAPWLLFLRPGTVLDTPWVGETQNFVQRGAASEAAAVFRRANSANGGAAEALHLLLPAFTRRPRPQQGLLIARDFYFKLGGHAAGADAEAELLRRIGRRRIATLATHAFPPET